MKHIWGCALLSVLVMAGALSACSKEPAAEGGTEDGAASETAAPAASSEAGAPAAAPAAPAAGTVIQTQEMNMPGVTAELTEASREDGVLTVKVRFRNAGSERQYKSLETGHGDYGLFYVTAGEQKYFILHDSEGAPLAPVYLTLDLEPGGQQLWWAKFPAPPAAVTAFDLIMPEVLPFEDVPITDS